MTTENESLSKAFLEEKLQIKEDDQDELHWI